MNNLMGLIGLIRGAANPMQFLQQQAQNNPVIARALQMSNGRDSMEVARNIAKERGIDLDQYRRELGI